MSETIRFGLIIVLTAAVGLVAVLSNRLTEQLKLPVPALMLIAAAIAVKVIPALHAPQPRTVERLVTVALVCILFDGGAHIGWRRFREAAIPIVVVGVAGTFMTTAGAARCCCISRSASAGTPACWSPPRSRRPTRRWCSPSLAAARSPGAAPQSWKVNPAPTTRSGSR